MELSIIVPVYNAEKYLDKCLTSIQNQSFKDWECLLIDDGSKDKSRVICEYFAMQDSRFKVVSKFNQGPGQTRNLGIFLATGNWIGFVDADDWIQRDHFEYLITSASNANVSIAQTAVNVYRDSKLVKRWQLGNPGIYACSGRKILSQPAYDIGHCWDKIYKASILRENPTIRFPDCDMCEDTIFNIRYICHVGKILSLNKATYNYNLRNETLSHSGLQSNRRIKYIEDLAKMQKDLQSNLNYFYLSDFVVKHFEAIVNRPANIDYVFPYVDCTKPQWQEQYAQYNSEIDSQRFEAHENLLKYKFRSIEKYMPWISTIHMIVSDISQVPDWVDQSKVHIVLHKDFIPERFLPTFNSCTIEMFLHKIPGLSEKFIYSNDDMYANDVLKPKFYFPDDSSIKADLQIRKLYKASDINQIWAQIPVNSYKLAARDAPGYYHKYVDGKNLYEPQHIGKPMLKSINKAVYEKYETEILSSITRFRSGVNLNQYLFIAYALFHGKGTFETFRFAYHHVGNDTDKIIAALEAKENRPRAICCNDGSGASSKDYQRIEVAFAKLYPEASCYELDPETN